MPPVGNQVMPDEHFITGPGLPAPSGPAPGGKIAVIGAGAAGLAAAWALSRRFDVTLFEAEPQLGGHAHTVDMDDDGRPLPVDTGFIVFNRLNYPLFSAALDHLGVATEASDMSFSVSVAIRGWKRPLEYAGGVWGGLFAQSGNLGRPRFWRMLAELRRFYRSAPADLDRMEQSGITLGAYLHAGGYSTVFRDAHLVPMAAAIWSQPMDQVAMMPAATLVRFFIGHGLFLLRGRPRWRTVSGGSREYVGRIRDRLPGGVHVRSPVRAVRRMADGVELAIEDGQKRFFDAVVIATHGDQALSLLADAGAEERRVLGAFGYRPNRAVLHGDPSLMPQSRKAWASWNFIAPQGDGGPQGVTYWMNRLQNLATDRQVFLSLNPPFEPHPDSVVGTFNYSHPVFDSAAIAAQRGLDAIQGRCHTWYCGSYHGYGFHEDAFSSGMDVARRLGAPVPWSDANEVSASTAGKSDAG